MRNNSINAPMLKVKNIPAHVKSKNDRAATPCMVTEEGTYYLIDGEFIPEWKFDILRPVIPLLPAVNKGENKNRKANFVNGIKSY